MIALDPDFVGSLAPPSKLTTAVNSTNDTPFARLPRLERLRIQGKADETEIADGGDDDEDTGGKKQDREEREKRKMRGKGKSMKRFVAFPLVKFVLEADCYFIDICGSSAKTLLTPQQCVPFQNLFPLFKLPNTFSMQVAVRAKLEKQKEMRRVAKAIATGAAETKKPSALDRFKRPF